MPAVRWRLTQNEIQTFKLDDGTATPQPIVDFGSANERYAQAGNVYYSDHVREDGYHRLTTDDLSTYILPIKFDIPAALEDGDVTFTVTGTAVAGVNYNLVTSSPLEISEGATEASITLEILEASGWFDERSIIITMTDATNFTLGSQLEYRLWVYPVGLASALEWNTTGQTAGEGTYAIQADISAAQLEQANIYYRVTASAGLIETTHYTVSPSGSRYVAIGDLNSEGASSDSPDITITAAGELVGGTITLELDHEPLDGSRRNWWTNTHSWKLEEYDSDFAAEPTTHAPGGWAWPDPDQDGDEDPPYPGATGCTVIGQDETVQPQTGQPYWTIPAGNQKTKPDGSVMQGVMMHEGAASDAYIRESFEGERVSGLKAVSASIDEYNLISVYVDDIPDPEAGRSSKFVKLTQRNRPKDTQNGVIFWRESDGDDAAGNASRLYSGGSSVATVTTDTGVWGLWTHENVHPLDKWGVEEETVDGVNYTRLWYRHYVPAAGYYTAQSKKRRGPTVNNPPVYPTATSADATGVTLTDENADFTGTNAVQVDDVVRNEADFSIATVVAVVDANTLTLSGLAGGFDDEFAIGDEYTISDHVNASSGLDTQQVQGDLQNAILRFTPYQKYDNFGSRANDSAFYQDNNNGQGKGMLVWGPLYLQSSSELLVSDAPTPYDPATGSLTGVGRYWEKAGNWPRPRGLAYMDTGSANLTYTFTVA